MSSFCLSSWVSTLKDENDNKLKEFLTVHLLLSHDAFTHVQAHT